MKKFIAPDGIALAWEEEGEGLPILCLPGLTRDASDFDDLAAALGGRYHLVRLTLRGRGDSDRDPEFTNYNLGVESRDVVAFLDHLGLERVVVVGTSRGGLIGMILAGIAKERLAGVLLNDIGPEIAPEGLEAIMSYLGLPPKGKTFDEVREGLKARMGTSFEGLSEARWDELAHRWFRAEGDGIGLTYDPKLRDATSSAPLKPDNNLWALFDQLGDVPVAVVHGMNSNILTAATVAQMQARRPDLIVADVPGRGHAPFLNEPEALAAFEALVARAEAGAA